MRHRHLLLATILCCSATTTAFAQTVKIGLLGDSITDEYRADDNRGGAYASTTLNWLELLTRYRPVDPGTWGTRAEPRRTGYERNWARSAAVAADVVAQGQADGLALQVAAGDVDVAVLIVGSNDFDIWNGTYAAVYNGTIAGPALTAKIDGIVDSIAAAVDTVQAAGSVEMLVANVTDRGATARFVSMFPDPAKRQIVTNAIVAVNDGIADAMAARGVAVIDLYNLATTLLGQIDGSGNLIVGGQAISLVVNGDEPHHVLLGDAEHAGTVFSGVMANYILDAIENDGGPAIARFTDLEELHNAGIYPSVTTYPTSYTVTSGTHQSGGLSSLVSNDNQYLVFGSTTSGSPRTTDVEYDFSGASTAPASLDFNFIAKSSTSSTSVSYYLYNQVTSAWVPMSTVSIGTSEVTSHFYGTAADGAANYVSPTGVVRVRCTSSRSTTHSLSMEQVRFIYTY